jgi:hypothetical protein
MVGITFPEFTSIVSSIGIILWLRILTKDYKNIPAPFIAVYSLSICVTAFIISVGYIIYTNINP